MQVHSYAFDFFEELSKGKINNQSISNFNREKLITQISSDKTQCVLYSCLIKIEN
jgi:hypothetical protein